MISDELDPNVVNSLRSSALEGMPASQLLHLLQSLVRFSNDPCSRSIATCYFCEAFDWWIHEAKPLGAWHFFEGSNWTDQEIDAEYASLLLAWREMNGGNGGKRGQAGMALN